MDVDWAADVKKFVPDADDGVIKALVRYCGIALRNRDSSLVSFSDPTETARVRNNFLKKKLGLTHSDEDLDAGIAAVGARMKGSNFKNRVTVYYLLLDQFDMFPSFGGVAKAAGGAVAAGAAALGLAAMGGSDDDAPVDTGSDADGASLGDKALAAGAVAVGAVGAAAAGAASLASDAGSAVADTAGKAGAAVAGAADAAVAGVSGAASSAAAGISSGVQALTGNSDDDTKGGWGWLWWLLLALLALFLIWWLFFRQPAASTDAGNAIATEAAAVETSAASSAAVDLAAAPAEGSVTIPTGAGVTSELRAGVPVVKVYFDTGKVDVAEAFGPAAGGLKAYLAANAGKTLEVSGYNDPTGNAAANAELSKNRAKAVGAALVAAGIPEASVALVKPESSTDTTVSKEAARRVEVTVK